MDKSKIFYVYVHRKRSDGSVFYVGKGKLSRHSDKRGRSDWWRSVVERHGFTSSIEYYGMSEKCAFTMEKILIGIHRRYGADLVNLCDGGEGVSGVVSLKRRVVYSSCGMKFNHSMEAADYLSTNGYALASRTKISDCCNGKRMSAYDRAWSYCGFPKKPLVTGPRAGSFYTEVPIGDRVSRKIYTSKGEVFDNSRIACQFLRENGYPKASWGNIGSCARGEVNSSYDRAWSYEGFPEKPKYIGVKGRSIKQSKPVYCSNGMRFNSAEKAREWLVSIGWKSAHGTPIARCCNGKAKTAYGFSWVYE